MLLCLACAATPPAPRDADPGCAPFVWLPDPALGPHAALAIPVRIGDAVRHLQLDTGLDVSAIDGLETAEALGLPVERDADGDPWTTLSGRVGAVDFTEHRFSIAVPPPGEPPPPPPETPPPVPVVGSIGLDLLRGHVATLDFAGRRFCLADRPPADLADRLDFAPATLADGKLFIAARLGDRALPRVFYDSGASALTLVLDRARWQAETDGETARRPARSWSRIFTLVHGAGRAPLTVAGVRIEAPELTYVAEAPRLFADWPFAVDGQLGNAPFLDRAVVLDLGAAPRFGVSRTGAASAPGSAE